MSQHNGLKHPVGPPKHLLSSSGHVAPTLALLGHRAVIRVSQDSFILTVPSKLSVWVDHRSLLTEALGLLWVVSLSLPVMERESVLTLFF